MEAHEAEEYKRLEAAGAQVVQKRPGPASGWAGAICESAVAFLEE